MNNWIPLDGCHQKPRKNEVVILTDGKDIFHDMVWLDEFKHDGRIIPCGWYHVNGVEPMDIKLTHWLVLGLPR